MACADHSTKSAGRGGCIAAALIVLALLANIAWSDTAQANAAQAAAGAAATSETNSCGGQFKGAQLYNCLAGVADRLASRLQGTGNIGVAIASDVRTAAAAIRQGSKQAAVAALSQVRSTISGFMRQIKDKRGGDTPGMNSLSSSMSTMIRVIQSKG